MKRDGLIYGLVILVFGLGLFLCGCDYEDWNGDDVEYINGIAVPPEPDAVEDATTVAGVDSDGDGVRDAVERRIAEEFGEDLEVWERALNYAIALQNAIMDPTSENIELYDNIVLSEDDELIDMFESIDNISIDTKIRVKAYREAFAGTITVIPSN